MQTASDRDADERVLMKSAAIAVRDDGMAPRLEVKTAVMALVFRQSKSPIPLHDRIRPTQTSTHYQVPLMKRDNHRNRHLSLCRSNKMLHHKNRLTVHLPAIRSSYRIETASGTVDINLMFDRFSLMLSRNLSFLSTLAMHHPASTLDCIIPTLPPTL